MCEFWVFLLLFIWLLLFIIYIYELSDILFIGYVLFGWIVGFEDLYYENDF